MSQIKKIGVLTGGGDCPGLNAVIRGVTKTAINQYGASVIGFMDGFKGLVLNHYMDLDLRAVSGIGHTGGTILGTTNRDNPFHFMMDENVNEFSDESDRAIENLRKLEVDGLIVIGGDGSLHIAQNFYQKGVKVVGVPKTIDNDLSATDVTFGFNTAVNTASEALDKLHTTAESHHRVMVLEVMGRYAGWIALYAGISGGADVILIPEIPYDMPCILKKIKQRYNEGKKFSIIVVAEGAAPKDGEMVVQKLVPTSHDPVRLGGIGNKLAEDIEQLTGIESRVTVLGHLQRGGAPIPYDRILSTRYGVAAVNALMEGKEGTMVSLKGVDIATVPLIDAIEVLKKVDVNSNFINTARAVGISFGDE
ncbi:MAG TPA: 6-phosphofructokinase [Syntrophomonas sp.]|nr:6-phosphofructokinase [Syntrophomonas sp.]HCF70200.1 6-phosphofructokinase [Syntrophomonas sp.]